MLLLLIARSLSSHGIAHLLPASQPSTVGLISECTLTDRQEFVAAQPKMEAPSPAYGAGLPVACCCCFCCSVAERVAAAAQPRLFSGATFLSPGWLLNELLIYLLVCVAIVACQPSSSSPLASSASSASAVAECVSVSIDGCELLAPAVRLRISAANKTMRIHNGRST